MFSDRRSSRSSFVLVLLFVIHGAVDPVRDAWSFRSVEQTQERQSQAANATPESCSEPINHGEMLQAGFETRRNGASIGRDPRVFDSVGVNSRVKKSVKLVSVILRANQFVRYDILRIEFPQPKYRPDQDVLLAADFDYLHTPTHETRGKPWNGFFCVL